MAQVQEVQRQTTGKTHRQAQHINTPSVNVNTANNAA